MNNNKAVQEKLEHLKTVISHTAAARPIPNIALSKITPISHYLTGEAAFAALNDAIRRLVHAVPEDHDVIVCAFGLNVMDVRYAKPHTFIFEGVDDLGDAAYAIVHYSQLVAHVVHRAKQGPERVITGFSQVGEVEQ